MSKNTNQIPPNKHIIKVRFSDDDMLITSINGTPEEIHAYYIGQIFNLGTCADRVVKAVSVEIL